MPQVNWSTLLKHLNCQAGKVTGIARVPVSVIYRPVMITGSALYFARWLSHRFAVVFRLTLPGQFDAVFRPDDSSGLFSARMNIAL